MKLWILGAQGMLGKTLMRMCQGKNMDFFGTGHSETDITNLDSLRKVAQRESPTHLINCAAYTQVDVAEKEVDLAFAVNGLGPKNLGLLACEMGLKVVHVSTDYVFDGEKTIPYREVDTPHPLSVYGKSKLEGENNLLKVFPEACIVRTSWLFGEGGKNFISNLTALLKNNEEVRVVSDQYSRITFCGDLASALFSLMNASGVYHFANSGKVSRFDVALELFKRLDNIKCKRVIPVSHTAFVLAARRPLYSVMSTEKIEKELHITIPPWKEALEEFVSCAACS